MFPWPSKWVSATPATGPAAGGGARIWPAMVKAYSPLSMSLEQAQAGVETVAASGTSNSTNVGLELWLESACCAVAGEWDENASAATMLAVANVNFMLIP